MAKLTGDYRLLSEKPMYLSDGTPVFEVRRLGFNPTKAKREMKNVMQK